MKRLNEENSFTCPKCNKSWVFDSSDIVDGYLHCSCGEEIKAPMTFPESFYHYSARKSDLTYNEWINKAVKECIEELKKNPSIEYRSVECGFCFIVALHTEDGYQVIVTKDFYSFEVWEVE